MTTLIHIGVHKTATTELQRALTAAEWRMARAGLRFMGPAALRAPDIQLENALRDPDGAVAGQARTHLAQACEGQKHLLLSEENILGTTRRGSILGAGGEVYPQAALHLGRLLDLLGRGEAEIFMAVRDPAGFLTSTYGQHLRQPMPAHHDIFLRDFRLQVFSWADLAGRILSLPQVRRLTVWRYEDHGALRQQILQAMVGRRAALRVGPEARINPGISQQAYDTFVAAAMADTETPTRTLLARACKEFPKTPETAPMRILPPDLHADSLRHYDRDVAALASLDRVRLLRPDGQGADPSAAA